MQVCKSCQIEQPLSNFYKSTRTTSGYRGACKACAARMAKIRYDKTKTFMGHDGENIPMPSREVLVSMFDYHEDGYFIRKTPRGTQKSGSIVRGKVEKGGYRRLPISYDMFLFHRLVWMWHKGTEPKYIDHINNDREDNRIENLQPYDKKSNSRKQLRPKDNTSGFIGAHSYCRGGFVASICVDSVSRTIGYYQTLKEAVVAYNNAAIEFHGEAGKFKADQNIAEMKHRGWL